MQFGKRVPRQSTNAGESSDVNQLLTDMIAQGAVRSRGSRSRPIQSGRIEDEPYIEGLVNPITSGPLGELYNSADEWERNYSNDVLMQQAEAAKDPTGGITLHQQQMIQDELDTLPHATDEDMFRQDRVMNQLREFYKQQPAYDQARALYEQQHKMEKRRRMPGRDTDRDQENEQQPDSDDWVK